MEPILHYWQCIIFFWDFFSEEDKSQCLKNTVNGNAVFRFHAEFLELRIVLQDKDECKLIPSLLHGTIYFSV